MSPTHAMPNIGKRSATTSPAPAVLSSARVNHAAGRALFTKRSHRHGRRPPPRPAHPERHVVYPVHRLHGRGVEPRAGHEAHANGVHLVLPVPGGRGGAGGTGQGAGGRAVEGGGQCVRVVGVSGEQGRLRPLGAASAHALQRRAVPSGRSVSSSRCDPVVTTWRQGLAWPLLVTRVLPCHADTGQQGSQGGLAPCEEGVLRAKATHHHRAEQGVQRSAQPPRHRHVEQRQQQVAHQRAEGGALGLQGARQRWGGWRPSRPQVRQKN